MAARSPRRSAGTICLGCSSTPKRASVTGWSYCGGFCRGSHEIRRSDVMTLIVFPAIDLKAGQVVRLAEGDMDRATVYGDDPAAQAMIFAAQGANYLHVVDLDGAFAGASVNGEAGSARVVRFPGDVRVGGGIPAREAIGRLFGVGG